MVRFFCWSGPSQVAAAQHWAPSCPSTPTGNTVFSLTRALPWILAPQIDARSRLPTECERLPSDFLRPTGLKRIAFKCRSSSNNLCLLSAVIRCQIRKTAKPSSTFAWKNSFEAKSCLKCKNCREFVALVVDSTKFLMVRLILLMILRL